MNHIQTITNLVLMLDAALPAMDAAARAEKRREAGKPLRQITDQERAKHARELVAKVAKEYGIGIGKW